MNILQYLLQKYPNRPWNWLVISRNPNLTMEMIEKLPNKPWDWYSISYNPNITTEDIEKYPNKPWNWYGISANPNITIKFIETNINKKCNPYNGHLQLKFEVAKINCYMLSSNTFIYENNRIKKKESYWLLEGIQVFNKTLNLVMLDKYM